MPAHEALMNTLEALEVDAPCNPVTSYLDKGPPNYKWMARIGYYGWALRFGNANDIKKAKDLVKDMLNRFSKFGLFTPSNEVTEVFLGSPHRNFELYPACLGVLLAEEDHDDNLATSIAHVINSDMVYTRACADNTKNKPVMPGTRFKEGRPVDTCWDVLEIFYREYFVMPQKGNAADPKHGTWRNDRDRACCRIFRNNRSKIMSHVNGSGQSWLLPLPVNLVIRDYRHGYTVSLEKSAHDSVVLPSKEVVSAVAVSPDGTLIDYVRDWSKGLDVSQLGEPGSSYVFR